MKKVKHDFRKSEKYFYFSEKDLQAPFILCYNTHPITERRKRGDLMAGSGIKIVAKNQKARHEYFIDETFEAGIELVGTEVKSIRAGTLSLKEAWCQIKDGEIFIKQMHIAPYEKGNIFNKDPLRPRRLLMHKREINRLYGKVRQDGVSIIPLSVYLKNSRVKVEIALCRGKKLYDKRDDAAVRDAKRQIDRVMKERNH